jgi:hypothetical protein
MGIVQRPLPENILMPFTSELRRELSPALLQTVSNAAIWCSREKTSGNSFRSLELDPSAILEVLKFPHDKESIEAWIEKKRDCYLRAVSWINQTRSQFLKTANTETPEADALSKSKLLLYEPLETVTDGAAEAASLGFFNLEDAPPWDTWFMYADHAIFCCIPESASTRAQAGIDANPVDCIHWANWSDLARIERP